MKEYDAYTLYNALRLHFETDSYDAIKYNYKTNISPQSFFKRKDKYFFAKIAKNYEKDVIGYLVSNFKEGVSYVGDMINEDGETNYRHHQRVLQSLSKCYKDDLNKIDNLDKCLISEDNQHPKIIQLLMQGDIHLETVVILNSILEFVQREDSKISDTIIWPDIKRKILKYQPFVSFDYDKFKKITIERFTNV
jgi:hypothetical protein